MNGPLAAISDEEYGRRISRAWTDGLLDAVRRGDVAKASRSIRAWIAEYELKRLRRLAAFRALPWYRRAWLALTGKAPR